MKSEGLRRLACVMNNRIPWNPYQVIENYQLDSYIVTNLAIWRMMNDLRAR